jgi:hypothetical protein
MNKADGMNCMFPHPGLAVNDRAYFAAQESGGLDSSDICLEPDVIKRKGSRIVIREPFLYS